MATRHPADLAGHRGIDPTPLVEILSAFQKLRWLTAVGGHAAQKVKIPQGVDVVKVEVGHNSGLNGLRFHLSDGTAGGYLYKNSPSHVLGE